MKISARAVIHGMAMGLLVTSLAACDKQETAANERGPAERAGQQIDQAAARAGEELNKAAEKAGKGLQQLGQKLEREGQEAQEPQEPQKKE